MVTDNAANVTSLRRQFLEKQEHMFKGCSAHSANLLAKDVCDTQEAIKVLSKILLILLNPVCEALTLFQNETTTSKASQIWKKMLNKCTASFKELTVKRINDALSPPLLVANLLDHQGTFKKLCSHQVKLRLASSTFISVNRIS